MSASPSAEYSQFIETVSWYWFAYESGLSLRRAKSVLLANATEVGFSLHEILQSPSPAQRLGLSEEEGDLIAKNVSGLGAVQTRITGWREHGLGLVRLGEPAYPPILRTHMNLNERPLLLNHRGDPGLLELPTVLALAGTDDSEETQSWAGEVLVDLAAEGALPLLVDLPAHQPLLSRLLEVEAAVAIVMPQGLAAFRPSSPLQTAIDSGRALLLSPFRPDWTPPAGQDNVMETHASAFAQALAYALILLSPPYPTNLLPQQPCFLRPGIPKTVGCQTYYDDAESFFLALSEIPAMAAPFVSESAPTPQPQPLAEPPLDAEKLINRLAEMGNVPEAMKARLRRQNISA
ncbi:MAG: hypothetical protein J5I90_04280 [Caldilineales bacterium]|nr:hypothetical protein [Caldilineales bacterium]